MSKSLIFNESLHIRIGVFLISFFLNLTFHQDTNTAILNSSLLFFLISTSQFLTDSDIKVNRWSILFLGFLPLFLLKFDIYIYFFTYGVLVFWILVKLFKYKITIILIGIIYIFISQIYSGKIMSFPLNFNLDLLFFSSDSIQNSIEKHQLDAMYLPYKLRGLLFNELVYIYSILTHLLEFLSLKMLYENLLVVNLYPLFVGILISFKRFNRLDNLFIWGSIITTLLSIGINRAPDKSIPLFIFSPFLVALICVGLEKINNKLYFFLLLFNLVIYLA